MPLRNTYHLIPNERPLEWDELCEYDALGTREQAGWTARLLMLLQPPTCYGVFGAWGSGKTTYMKAVQAVIKQEHPDEIVTSWFDVWIYDQATGDEVCFALARKVISDIKGTGDGARVGDKAWEALLAGLFSGVKMATTVATAGLVDLGQIQADYDKARAELAGRLSAWVDATDRLRSEFASTVEAALKESNKQCAIVFVDDLDRCLPHNAVNVLERMKSIFLASNVPLIFVLGAGRSAIVEAITKGYGYSPEFSDRYLDKVVTDYTTLTGSGAHAHFAQLLLRVLSEQGKGDPKQVVDAVAGAFQELADRIPAARNPRVARKVAIKVALLLLRYGSMRNDGSDIDMKALADAWDSGRGGPFPTRLAGSALFKITLQIMTLRELYPTAFGEYNEELLLSVARMSKVLTTTPLATAQLDAELQVAAKYHLDGSRAMAVAMILASPDNLHVHHFVHTTCRSLL